MAAVTVSLSPPFELKDDAFFQLCQNNPDVKFERTATRELVVIYRQGQSVEVLEATAVLSGEEILPGFVLPLDRIF
jgi:hypothetical protein